VFEFVSRLCPIQNIIIALSQLQKYRSAKQTETQHPGSIIWDEQPLLKAADNYFCYLLPTSTRALDPDHTIRPLSPESALDLLYIKLELCTPRLLFATPAETDIRRKNPALICNTTFVTTW